MKKVLNIICWCLGLVLIFLSFLALTPSIPSEKVPPQKLAVFDLSALIGMAVFLIGNLLLKTKKIDLQFNSNRKIARFYCSIFLVYLVVHIVLRSILFFELADVYGNVLYNICVHSFVYSLVMTLIFFGITWPRKNKGKIKAPG